tara:strand:+ start:3388 stop:4857 length:1470 start_codon:yes stop_codon:yes gene_type:complete
MTACLLDRSMTLRVYDTRSRSKRVLKPLVDGQIGIYACGITPYSPSHIGHARQAIAFDIIVRWLRKSGYQVNYVANFTDIDDKIIAVSLEEGVDFLEVANRNIHDYFRVMDSLNVVRANSYPRVTETIPEIIEMINQLIDKKHAYVADDGVYFEIDTAPEKYGQLTGQTLEMVRKGAGGRVGKTGSGKRDHRDFALWKSAKEGEPNWESPWGNGRPGWHIECSAMSLKHLGERFDIHGGGTDLTFPHHEAEIFQSECCLGHEPVVQYWLHNGMINVNGEKMSKSEGNFWTVSDALEQIDPLVLRYALINAPYRQPVDFNSVMIDDSTSHNARLVDSYSEALYLLKGVKNDYSGIDHLSEAANRFCSGMDDDFNTRIALVEVQLIVKKLNSLIYSNEEDHGLMASYVAWLEEFAGDVLGILPSSEIALSMYDEKLSRRSDISARVESLLEMRESARVSKNWTESDRIRDELADIGVVVEDAPEGAKWRLE